MWLGAREAHGRSHRMLSQRDGHHFARRSHGGDGGETEEREGERSDAPRSPRRDSWFLHGLFVDLCRMTRQAAHRSLTEFQRLGHARLRARIVAFKAIDMEESSPGADYFSRIVDRARGSKRASERHLYEFPRS